MDFIENKLEGYNNYVLRCTQKQAKGINMHYINY